MPPPHAAEPNSRCADWPALPLDAWQDTYATLHRWAQIVGKIRLGRMPWINRNPFTEEDAECAEEFPPRSLRPPR